MRISDWSSDVCSSDLPAPRSRRKSEKAFTLRFHLGRALSASLTADRLGALLRINGGPLWQFRASEGSLAIEESLWVDGEGRPHPTEQLVVTGTAPAGGASIGWIFKHNGSSRRPRKAPAN